MFIHSVYFWLKDDLTAEQKETFVTRINALRQIESVRHVFIGVPAATDRPVIDRSYSYALTLVFDDLEGHDRYQVDPLHEQFVEGCGTFWNKVLIYDSVEQG